jgi:superfamily II DNA/RNA helicase
VLDEADRMLDMGFYDDIIKIVAQLPEKRQTILFSATMPQNIQTLAKNILHDPVEIKIAVAKPVEKIHQMAYVCYEPMKDKILIDLLTKEQMDRVILFVSSKLKVKEITRMLKMRKMDAECMHSDLTQAERDEIMLRFKNRHISILVATDIVARGIDIDDIQTVINYDVPHDGEDYIHRIGRTARANREGEAITLVSPNDIVYMQRIERLMEREIEKPQLPEGCGESPEYIASRGSRSGKDRGRGGRNMHGRHRGNRGNAHDGSHKNGELANKHKSSQKNQNLPPKSESQVANSLPKTNKRRHRANNKPSAKTEPQTPKE